jgi:hypothetical protein
MHVFLHALPLSPHRTRWDAARPDLFQELRAFGRIAVVVVLLGADAGLRCITSGKATL